MNNEEHENSANKKARVVWSREMHDKFEVAVNQLGIDKAVPKKILELMNVDNLTRENVASHLQKYKLHLKKIECMENQQANMAAEPSHFRRGYMNGIRNFQTLNGSSVVQSNRTNCYPPSECFRQAAMPPTFNMPSVPLQHSSIASQSNNQYLDSMQCMHCKGVLPTSTPKQQANSIVPLQRWHDHNNQDANYHSNFIGNSINSMTPMNGAVDPERRTSTYTTEQESLKQHQLYSMYQQQSQHQTCNANNNHGSFEDLITEMTKTLKKEISKEMAASRDENRQLRETIEAMMKQQDTLMQAAQQIILSRQQQQQPEPAQAFTNVSPDVVMENQPEPAQTIAEASPDAMMEQQPNQQEQPGPAHTFGDDSPDAVMEQQQQPELTQTVKDVSPHGVTTQQPDQNSSRSRPRHPLMSRSSSSA